MWVYSTSKYFSNTTVSLEWPINIYLSLNGFLSQTIKLCVFVLSPCKIPIVEKALGVILGLFGMALVGVIICLLITCLQLHKS